MGYNSVVFRVWSEPGTEYHVKDITAYAIQANLEIRTATNFDSVSASTYRALYRTNALGIQIEETPKYYDCAIEDKCIDKYSYERKQK